MKVLITGGSSLLGKYLLSTAPRGIRIDTTWYTNFIGPQTNYQMSLFDQSHVNYVVGKSRPDIIIHCAANGSVDYAERNYEEVYKCIVGGTMYLVQAALEADTKLIYISSNAVFDGEKPPYNDYSVRNSVNNYGELKIKAEDSVIQHRINWVVIRPHLLYGYPWRNGRGNWVTTIAKALSNGKELKLVNDSIWQPTYAGDCAKAIWKLIGQTQRTFNVSSGDSMTLYELGLKVARSFGLSKAGLIPVSSGHFVNAAARPKDTSYDTSSFSGLELSSVDEGLEKMRRDGA